MQQPVRSIPHNQYGFSRSAAVGAVLLLSLLASSGCGDRNHFGTPPPKSAFDGQKLSLSCPDPAMADALTPMVRAWEARTGATVAVTRDPMAPAGGADVGIIAAGELGAWAEPGHLAPVPAKLRSEPVFQWTGLLPAYGERLVEWGGQTLAVPLTGDGHVLVYRADRFGEKTALDALPARGASVLSTWEGVAEVAVLFAKLDKKPSLPPLPTDPDRLFDLLSRVASSADRPALNDFQLAARAAKDRDALGFQFAVTTGRPRLRASGYVLAAEWLARLREGGALPAPGGNDDPVAALAEGRAVMALLSLDQLARLPREGGAVPARFALAGVPGARDVFDADQNKGVPGANPNLVPHFGGGRLGVVRAGCQHQDAAFDLLAELGGPARSAELVATPGLGAGPTRVAHVDRERLILWLGYGFDEERSKLLQDLMRHYTEQAVKNPTFGLRGPDRAALIAAADPAVRALGTGGVPPRDRLKQVEDAWQALDAKEQPATLLRWRQRAAGLN